MTRLEELLAPERAEPSAQIDVPPPEPSVPSARARTAYRPALDILKLLAAFGVICVHFGPQAPFAQNIVSVFLPFRVPFFIAAAFYFLCLFLRRDSSLAEFQRRLTAIVVPYLAWTLIYTVLRVVKHLDEPARLIALNLELPRFLLVGESAVHMYFVPMICAGFVFSYVLCRATSSWFFRPASICLLFLLGAGWHVVIPAAVHADITAAVGRWGIWACESLPYLATAMILTAPRVRTAMERRPHLYFSVCAALVLAYIILARYGPGLSLTLLSSWLIANLVLVIGLNTPLQARTCAAAKPFLQSSFGIYLSHYVFIQILVWGEEEFAWQNVASLNTAWFFAVCAAVFVLSTFFTLAVARLPVISFVLLGRTAR